MMDLSDPQRELLLALYHGGGREQVYNLCSQTGRRKTGLKRLEDFGYVKISGDPPVYQNEADQRLVTLTAEGRSVAEERSPSDNGAADTTPPAREEPVASSQPRQAHTLAAEPVHAHAQAQQAGRTGESKLDFLARHYLGKRVKIYADAIPATGTLTTIGKDFVHIVTSDGYDLIYSEDDIEVTVFNRKAG